MKRMSFWLVLVLLLGALCGCFNLTVDKPLVDLGGDKTYPSHKEQQEPAPDDTPSEQQTRE